MSKKLYAMLLPVLAVVAFASMAGAAQAAPKWEVCKKLTTETGKFTDSECQKAGKGFWEWVVLPEKPKTQVVTFGKLTLKTKTITIECKVLDGGNIWNVAAGGLDEITAFFNYECKTTVGICLEPEIIASGLPWKTELLAGPIDKITGIKVTVFCEKKAVALFEGELNPKIVNGTEAHPTQAEFTSTTGKLKAGAEEAEVLGKDNILVEENGEDVRVK